jgi:hypothetical protein
MGHWSTGLPLVEAVGAQPLLKMRPNKVVMLTLSTFVIAFGSVLTSVWWACKDETMTRN